MDAAAAAAPMHEAAQAPAGTTAAVLGTSLPLSQISQVTMRVLGPCKMGISFWPMFRFKAPDREEKPGRASLTPPAAEPTEDPAAERAAEPTAEPAADSSATASNDTPGASQLLHVDFTQQPPDEFSVGAKVLCGIPFPFLRIRTTRLAGVVDPATGRVELEFQAQFLAQIGRGDSPTVLPINAQLTSEVATAFTKSLTGSRLQQGHTTLVSAAEVPKTNSWFVNLILWLPTAATAVLPMQLEFS